jgi:hypothetical protein
MNSEFGSIFQSSAQQIALSKHSQCSSVCLVRDFCRWSWLLVEGGTALTEGNRNTRRITCPNVNLSTTNLTLNDPEWTLNIGFQNRANQEFFCKYRMKFSSYQSVNTVTNHRKSCLENMPVYSENFAKKNIITVCRENVKNINTFGGKM